MKDELSSKYNLTKLGVFGSFARNEQSDVSDLDIVVELARSNMFDLIGIKQEIEEQLNLPVDIVQYREKMNSFLKRRIDNDALYL
ncbi:MAG: nucleotidyltransferase domain-containing protein [Proteobacteria bacterium]|nr:nucleotidyltransferase domain-containing protein [Pseudomonadota bacterium]